MQSTSSKKQISDFPTQQPQSQNVNWKRRNTKKSNNKQNGSQLYPIPFPHSNFQSLNFTSGKKRNQNPSNNDVNVFLRNHGPFQKAFQEALNTSYQGFACDLPPNSSSSSSNLSQNTKKMSPSSDANNHNHTNTNTHSHHYHNFPQERIQKALQTMHQSNYFRWDITQPFGLGTKCAKTYVTRCLLGEEGTTYKYLGLRMFSHPWKKTTTDQTMKMTKVSSSSLSSSSSSSSSTSSTSIKEALSTLNDLNTILTERTKCHLQSLDKSRKESSRRALYESQNSNYNENENEKGNSQLSTIRGRACFDVTLINRMVDSNDLKMEPMSSSAALAFEEESPSSFIKKKELSKEKSSHVTNGIPRTSVSWHADSCLEHYSSIAVYHTIIPDSKSSNAQVPSEKNSRTEMNSKSTSKSKTHRQWSVALRVLHNAEGPNASSSSFPSQSSFSSSYQDQESLSKDSNNLAPPPPPPISISLPSGSAYYLLEDFNHHHQHAVLAEDSVTNSSSQNEDTSHSPLPSSNLGIRYSSTHRLLRQGHNVFFILSRCQSVCSNFHKKGIKVWKTEQALLTEMESDWLRQFFVQGIGHKDLLWDWWNGPIMKLFHYWTILEKRTKTIIDLLRYAAEEKVGTYDIHKEETNNPKSSRINRKMKEKRKKAFLSMQDILQRTQIDDWPGSNNESSLHKPQFQQQQQMSLNTKASITIYEPLAECIRDRATKRKHWKSRENDPVFFSVDKDCRPIPFPVKYNCTSLDPNDTNNYAFSPLGGTPVELLSIADAVSAWGKCFDSGNPEWIPNEVLGYSTSQNTSSESNIIATCPTNEPNETSVHLKDIEEVDMHCKDIDWDGWKGSKSFGLEMQVPWARHLLKGEKTIETRAYALPPSLMGKRIEILESRSGEDGVSGLGNIIHEESLNIDRRQSQISKYVNQVGWCTFEKVIEYKCQNEFENDEHLHMVKRSSGYGWKKGVTKVLYGWVVGKYEFYDDAKKSICNNSHLTSMIRRMRSLFELVIVPKKGYLRKQKRSKRKSKAKKRDGKTTKKRRY